jgi:hypothetical protein
MATGNALVVRVPEGQSPHLVQEQLPLPIPGTGQVQVKVSHVAQNPTDGRSLCPAVDEYFTRLTLNQYNVLMSMLLGTELFWAVISSEK